MEGGAEYIKISGLDCRIFPTIILGKLCIMAGNSRKISVNQLKRREINMGAWGVGINSNDTASDLREEYEVAFYYNDVETALKKIEAMVRKNGTDETDEIEWPDYIYSLADFMWKKGILTDHVREQALDLIDRGVGLSEWGEEGKSILRQREKVLEKFRNQLLSPMPEKKKIRLSINTKTIFEPGDVIALRLQTKGKERIVECPERKELDEMMDGKYILIRKIYDRVFWTSELEPEVKNISPIFQLYNYYSNEVPALSTITQLTPLLLPNGVYNSGIQTQGLFYTEAKLSYFRKHEYQLIGNYQDNIDEIVEYTSLGFFLGQAATDFRIIDLLFPDK